MNKIEDNKIIYKTENFFEKQKSDTMIGKDMQLEYIWKIN